MEEEGKEMISSVLGKIYSLFQNLEENFVDAK